MKSVKSCSRDSQESMSEGGQSASFIYISREGLHTNTHTLLHGAVTRRLLPARLMCHHVSFLCRWNSHTVTNTYLNRFSRKRPSAAPTKKPFDSFFVLLFLFPLMSCTVNENSTLLLNYLTSLLVCKKPSVCFIGLVFC